MTKEEIKIAIENAKVGKDNSTEILAFFDAKHAYCVHGMKYSNEMLLVPTKLFPGRVTALDELPDDIEGMEALWYHELMDKFGGIFEAMESVK